MSQQSEVADAIGDSLDAGGIVSVAALVRQIRDRWGVAASVPSVHAFVREVVTCLLHREEFQVGDIKEGVFAGWNLEPWEADELIDRELMSMREFFADDAHVVFRKKRYAA